MVDRLLVLPNKIHRCLKALFFFIFKFVTSETKNLLLQEPVRFWLAH